MAGELQRGQGLEVRIRDIGISSNSKTEEFGGD